jgi:hypothetical protein
MFLKERYYIKTLFVSIAICLSAFCQLTFAEDQDDWPDYDSASEQNEVSTQSASYMQNRSSYAFNCFAFRGGSICQYCYLFVGLLPIDFQLNKMKSQRYMISTLMPSIALRSANPDLNTYGDGWNNGIELGFRPYINFGYAFELSGFASESDNDDLPSLTRTQLLAKGLFNFAGSTPVIQYSYIGAGLGPIWDNIENDVATAIGFVPTIGFDIPIENSNRGLMLGANANYLFITADRPESFALNGNIKYQF